MRGMVPRRTATSLDEMLTVLAEPRRRMILRAIWDEELAAGAIHEAVGEVTFGAVSQHLRILREAGAVRVRREGRHRFYSIDREALGALAHMLDEMWGAGLSRLKRAAESEARKKRPKGRGT